MPVRRRTIGVLVLGFGICLASCQKTSEESVEWVTGSVRSADGVQVSYQMAGEGAPRP